MQTIKDKEFGGERPLFASHGLILNNVTIHAGESAIKESSDITATGCRFEGKYPFWHVDNFTIEHCLFTEGARAALWYSSRLTMRDTQVDAPKMFREMRHLTLTDVRIPDAEETLWHCSDIRLRDVEVKNADYIFMHCRDIDISGYHQEGNYSFQYCKNVEISDAVILSKDAFWNTENVTVRDSVIDGEYLGWHSHNLRLINCRIGGTQPLCYAHNLVMENCEMAADCDLAFEYSSVNASIRGDVRSIKNPRTGCITLGSCGEIITDANIKAPADCKIIETSKQKERNKR